MSKSIPVNLKHMTMDNRVVIEKGWIQNFSFVVLQHYHVVEQDFSTIAKEIEKCRTFQEHNHYNEQKTSMCMSETAKRKTYAKSMLPFAREPASSVTTATPTVPTLHRVVTTAINWIRHPRIQ